jgi:hypothetical protein
MKWWREVAVGVCIAAAGASLGAAVDVRDRVAACEAADRQAGAVKAAEDRAAQEWRDGVKEDLKAIKSRLGVP